MVRLDIGWPAHVMPGHWIRVPCSDTRPQNLAEHRPKKYTAEAWEVAGGSIGYSPVTGASVLFSSNYVGRQYLDNTSNADRSLNPYLVTDLSMAYELKQNFARQLSFTLHLNNIFNQLYEANGWVYRYIYDGQSSVMDGYFPQAGFHWIHES